jgi:hypothetical protein
MFKNETHFVEKLNLDELYNRKFEVQQNRIQVYKKILERIHSKIKLTSRQKNDNEQCWYLMPEVELGCPLYNKRECLDYVLEKLIENGFNVKYYHPNLLFIYWGHYIPNHKRQEYKKKTGQTIDGFGNIIKKDDEELNNNKLFNNKKIIKKDDKNYTNIEEYKPTGNLIYGKELFKNINEKIN